MALDDFWAIHSSLSVTPVPHSHPRSPAHPKTVGRQRGEGAPLSLAQSVLVSPGASTRRSGPQPTSPSTTPPAGAASAPAGVPPFHTKPQTQSGKGPKRNPLKGARGPIQPSNPRSGGPGKAVHVDAMNITVQNSSKHKPTKQQSSDIKTWRGV